MPKLKVNQVPSYRLAIVTLNGRDCPARGTRQRREQK